MENDFWFRIAVIAAGVASIAMVTVVLFVE